MSKPMSIEELRYIQENKGTQHLVTYIFPYCHDGMFAKMEDLDLDKFLDLLKNEVKGVQEVFNLVVILEKQYRSNKRKEGIRE